MPSPAVCGAPLTCALPSRLLRPLTCALPSRLWRPVSEWDTDAVVAWLHEMGLSAYTAEARRWARSGSQLLRASPAELERELGLRVRRVGCGTGDGGRGTLQRHGLQTCEDVLLIVFLLCEI